MKVRLLPIKLAMVALVFGISIYSGAWVYRTFHLHETYIAPLIAAQDKAQRLADIAALQTDEPDSILFMPVWRTLVAEVRDTWSEPRPGYRTHEGQDIFASRNTPVLSATPGYVTRVDRDADTGLGGKSVMIVGSGGLRYYYAHLERIPEYLEELDRVSTTTVIGFVGNSGNAGNTSPHLHFGVYRSGWQAINPLPLITDRSNWRVF